MITYIEYILCSYARNARSTHDVIIVVPREEARTRLLSFVEIFSFLVSFLFFFWTLEDVTLFF